MHKNMNTKFVIAAIVGIAVIAGGSFWSGMTYAKGNMPRGQFGNGQLSGGTNFRGGSGNATRSVGGGFTAGEIISKYDSSITIKMQDDSTKIILVSDSTEV